MLVWQFRMLQFVMLVSIRKERRVDEDDEEVFSKRQKT